MKTSTPGSKPHIKESKMRSQPLPATHIPTPAEHHEVERA